MKHLRFTVKASTAALKLSVLAISTFMLATVFLPAALAQGGVGLKQSTIIDGTTIKLGDIFHGLSSNQDRVLGAAPLPGKDMVLNARTLLRVALAMDVDWRPASSGDRVLVQRAATVIEGADIQSGIQSALSDHDISPDYKIALHNPSTRIILPADQNATFDVKTLDIKKSQGQFEATIVAPSRSNPIQSIKISGTLKRMTQVPVLKETIRNGLIIGRHDIEYIDVPENAIQHDTVMNENELIGMTPRRVIGAGSVVKLNALAAPKLVSRGEHVTMFYKSGALTLTAQGKALENGAKGDTIRVTNLGSSKTIQARINGDKQVIVETF